MLRRTITIFILTSFFSCSEDPSVILPTVTTGEISVVEGNSVVGSGEVLDIGDSELIAIGLVAGEGQEPTLNDGISSQVDELALGKFTNELTGLRSNTNYFVRAYATNKAGTAYGEAIPVKTTIIIPATLEFNFLTEIKGYNLTQAIGFAGSEAWQSLFIANRQMDWTVGFQSEKLYKYDLITGDTVSIINPTLDYISKEVQFIANNPIVLGSQYVSTYDFTLTNPPIVIPTGKRLSRHGSAQKNDTIFVFGGDLNGLESDKIWRWDNSASEYQILTTMPGPKAYAGGEIVNNYLYIFGGQQEFSGTLPESSVYVYSFKDDSFETFYLPQVLYQSFTAKVGELIYIAGHTRLDRYADNTGIFFGVLNTQDNSFKEISINLTDALGASIWALTAIGNELYIVYGDPTTDIDDVTGEQTFTIQKAEIP